MGPVESQTGEERGERPPILDRVKFQTMEATRRPGVEGFERLGPVVTLTRSCEAAQNLRQGANEKR